MRVRLSDSFVKGVRNAMLFVLLLQGLFVLLQMAWETANIMKQQFVVDLSALQQDPLFALSLLMHVAVAILPCIAWIQCMVARRLELRKLFLYPMYFWFITDLFTIFLDIFMDDFNLFTTSPRDPWFALPFKVSTAIFFMIVIFYFLIDNKRRKTPRNDAWKQVPTSSRFICWFVDQLHIAYLVWFCFWMSGVMIFWMGDAEITIYHFIVPLGIMFFYYFVQEALFGQTIGKVFNKSAVRYSGNPILGALLRTIARFIPFEIFSFLGTSGRGWHDVISNTLVVRKERRKRNSEMDQILDVDFNK